ncbi:MAG: tRNA dihydrouridine synthase DusB [Acidimicrobiia bacterium]
MTTHPTRPLRIGPIEVDPPVVLAPMAGVTNASFRTLCRRFGAGLYVSEMLGARAIVENHARTLQSAEFGENEPIRSIQLYGIDPSTVAEAVRRLVDQDQVDHIDLNFGCPAPKVTRHGGGAALPFKWRRFESIVTTAVGRAGRVPVTVKFRMGIDDSHLTFLGAGRISEAAGAGAVALHARTAEQLYSGAARWAAIGELKEAVTSIPVLGNGDIWNASDATAMIDQTGCDGVVVGRGCLGRPWLFGELAQALAGRPITPPPGLRAVASIMIDHAELLVAQYGARRGMRSFRKHAAWYLNGFVVGHDVRRRLAAVETVEQITALMSSVDLDQDFPAEAARRPRGHTHGPRPVKLPHRYLDDPDTIEHLSPAAGLAVSGG